MSDQEKKVHRAQKSCANLAKEMREKVGTIPRWLFLLNVSRRNLIGALIDYVILKWVDDFGPYQCDQMA